VRRALVIPVAVAALLVPSAVLAANARADSSSCTFGSSSGNVYSCFGIQNTGTFVVEMNASAAVQNAGRTLDVGLYGPCTNTQCPRIKHTGWRFVSPGHLIGTTWTPMAPIAAGTYCGVTTRLNGNNTSTIIAQQCAKV